MKKLLIAPLLLALFLVTIPYSHAGDCSTRDKVEWHATISSATHIRVECDDHKGPVGESVGVAPAGEVVRILEVDRNREYFIVETSKGTGFIYKTFLKDITEAPLPQTEISVFKDLDKNHQYYDAIIDVKNRGIVSGTPEGNIKADDPINRVELAKILVEAINDDADIEKANLEADLYSDVEAGAWYLPYLKLAHDKGIMRGDDKSEVGPSTVRPGDFANGAEVAKMIAVAFTLEVPPAGEGEAWYEPHLEILRKRNALPYQDPSHIVTRGEMMFMISKVLQ